jgi:hypothetical protein
VWPARLIGAAFLRQIILLTVLRNSIKYTWCGCIMLAAHAAIAAPTLQGQSGYINMPSADVGRDGDLSLGYSYDSPYGAIWASSTILPFMQITGRYVSISGTPQFAENVVDPLFKNYGRYKDKVFDLKARVLAESGWMPAIAVGATDLHGTGLFKGRFLVATKTFGPERQVEASIGVGGRRPDGVFGGVRWHPASAPEWAVVAEYDGNDYSVDLEAASTGAAKRRKGAVVGLEYRWGWLGAQIARHQNHFSANVYATIPLAQREFVPKVYEPGYFKPKNAPLRLSTAQWRDDPRKAAPLIDALSKQNFKNIRITLDGETLRIALTNSRISQMGRAVGRAARTALAFAPTGTRALHITYTKIEQPIATYEFQDIGALSDYLAGASKRDAFLQTVHLRYATPADTIEGDRAAMVAGVDESAGLGIYANRDGNVIQISSEDREGNRFRITPKLGFFFNDPSGALRYELSAASAYNKRLGNGLYLNGAVQLTVLENVSEVTQGSNSLLPHVRSDIAEYNRGGRFKLNRLMLNQYLTPAERWYARVSGGFYEEMYRGVGAQVLYLPTDPRWAADLSVDALEQRGVKGWLDKRDYRTVTAIGALHYRLPYGMKVTARAGRFLAKDTGVRMEFKRRFQSGVEVGAWYTKTNGNDITSPGTPANPYHDKGVFVSIPLRSMLPADSQSLAGIAIGPWTRDVGQMVASPGDLYGMIEQPRRDMTAYDGLGNLAERPDEQNLPAVAVPDRPLPAAWPLFRLRLEQSKAAVPPLSSVAYGATLAGGAVLGSALLDKPVDKYVSKHADSRLARSWGNFGKNMPIALVATSGVAVAMGDERMQNTGIISLQAVAASLGVTAVGKYVVGRARPDEERGPWERIGAGQSRVNSAFPSAHSAMAFSAVTPFAQEYDAPWLYGVAAVSSMGRVAGRKHWVSDVVAGGIIGYATGTLLWKGQRENTRSQFSVAPGPKEISVSYQAKF